MKDFEPGVTAPPFHVWCRSTTVPYFDDEWGRSGERAARDEDGKTYYVPADMTYPEWKKSFVDGKTDGLEVVPDDGAKYHGGIPEKWKRIDSSNDDAVKNANPNYRKGMEYSMNCPNCACAYEMRKRGYDVVARPYVKGGSHHLNYSPWDVWEGAELKHFTSKNALYEYTLGCESGTRFGIAVQYLDNTGHVLVGEVVDNQFRIYDAQSGINVKSIDFDDIMGVELWQTNNLKLSDRGVTACEGR